MKKTIDKKMALKVLYANEDQVFHEEINGVNFLVAHGEDYTITGDYSTFRAVPLGIEIDLDPEMEVDFWDVGVIIAYPKKEGVETDPDDMFDWASEYDGDAPEVWDVGSKLPKSLQDDTGRNH